ncbi:hypothetical protein PG987_013552 [Apiospora arundinis]
MAIASRGITNLPFASKVEHWKVALGAWVYDLLQPNTIDILKTTCTLNTPTRMTTSGQGTPFLSKGSSYPSIRISDKNQHGHNPFPVPRGPVTAPLNFSRPPPPGVPAVNYVEAPPAGEPKRNLPLNPQPVTIHDIRGRESEFSLDHDGFLAIQPTTSDSNPTNNNNPEEKEEEAEVNFDDETSITTTPVLLTHVDQTATSVLQRIHRHLPESEASSILSNGTRYRIINVWRTLSPQGPLEANPPGVLLLVDFPRRRRHPRRAPLPVRLHGQTAAVAHHPDQKWYYWSGMTPRERLLLECFDSESLKAENAQVKGGRTPHSAFEDPRTRADAEGGRVSRFAPWFLGPEKE